MRKTIPGAWGPSPPSRDVKTWKALLTQSGTNPPTAKVLINTLGINPVWTRSTNGNYTLTVAPNTFIENTDPTGGTEVWAGNGELGQNISVSTGYIHDDAINIIASQGTSPDDNMLVNTPFTITVYPST